jgi:hypothetical protein
MNNLKTPSRLSRILIALAACCAGVILGYFVLKAPIIKISIADIPWPFDSLKNIHTYLYDRRLDYLMVASMVFFVTIPNIVLVAIATSFAMRYVNRPRIIFYSTLIWPALDYVVSLARILSLKKRLALRGLHPELGLLLRAEGLPVAAFNMLLSYVLFAIVVFAAFRLLSGIRSITPHSSGTLH